MFAPNELVATRPMCDRAAAASRVVVVLPLVPEMSATALPEARCASRSGSILRPIHPPMTEPSPRPAALESAAAVFDTLVATLARMGILPSVTGDEATRLAAYLGLMAARKLPNRLWPANTGL